MKPTTDIAGHDYYIVDPVPITSNTYESHNLYEELTGDHQLNNTNHYTDLHNGPVLPMRQLANPRTQTESHESQGRIDNTAYNSESSKSNDGDETEIEHHEYHEPIDNNEQVS